MEVLDTFLERGGRFVAKQLTGFGDIRPGLRDVTGLIGLTVDYGFFAKNLLNRLDHLAQGDGLVVAQIHHLVIAPIVVQGTEDAFDGIGDEGVVPAGRTVAENGDGLSGLDEADEFIDRQVGSLTGAVNGEEAQSEEADAIEVAVNMAEQFAADLGAGIGADGLEHMVVLLPGDVRIDAIDRGGRGEDKLFDPLLSGELEQVLGGDDVGPLVAGGILDGGADAGFGGEVDDGVETTPPAGHPSFRRRGVLREAICNKFDFRVGLRFCEIRFDQLKALVRQVRLDIRIFEGPIVERIKVIYANNGMAIRKKPFEGVRADKSSATRKEDFHY